MPFTGRCRRVSRVTLLFAVIAGVSFALAVPSGARAATGTASATATATIKKAAKKPVKKPAKKRVVYCTAAQKAKKAKGKRVACVVKAKVCTTRVKGKLVKVKCPTPPKRVKALTTYLDEDGVDDEPGQKDLNATSVDSTATALLVTINWDIFGLNGNNTADACSLFDTDGDGRVNVSACVTWGSAPPSLRSLVLYDCNDSRLDRCGAPSVRSASTATVCTLGQAADPFTAPITGERVFDARASCTLQLSDLGAGARLVNTCSYPSQQPNSDPSDCILIPRDGALGLAKVLVGGPAGYSGPFAISYSCTRAESPTFSAAQPVAAGTSISVPMPAGYTCAVSEALPAAPTGYAWSGSPAYSAPNPVAIVSDTTATVTVTNTLVREQGTLTVRKVMAGGTGSFSFTGSVAGTISVNEGTLSSVVDTGANHSVSESDAPGWDLTGAACTLADGTSATGTRNGATIANIEVRAGQATTCTFTNSRRPTLRVIKHVVNDDGGAAAAEDWSLTVTPPDGPALSAPGSETGTLYTLAPGAYTIGERPQNIESPITRGYTPSLAACNGGAITLAYGDTATCTVVNDDAAPRLLLEKDVVGGGAQPGAFTLRAGGEGNSARDYAKPGVAVGAAGEPQAMLIGVTYRLSETGPAGYESDGVWSCRDRAGDGEQPALAAPRFVAPDRLTLRAGDDVICAITNRYRDLALTKVADRATYQPGETITYTLIVTNVGAATIPVAAISLADPTLPAVAPVGTQPAALAPGQSLPYTGTRLATTALCGQLTNTATVTAPDEGNLANNVATVTVTVTGSACDPQVAGPVPTTIGVDKSGPATAILARWVTYRIRVTNTGATSAFNVVVSDVIPKGMALRSVPKGARLRSGVVTWSIGTLAPGASRTLVIVMRSGGTKAIRRCNTGVVAADNAARASDRHCTRFVRVAGVSNVPRVTG